MQNHGNGFDTAAFTKVCDQHIITWVLGVMVLQTLMMVLLFDCNTFLHCLPLTIGKKPVQK